MSTARSQFPNYHRHGDIDSTPSGIPSRRVLKIPLPTYYVNRASLFLSLAREFSSAPRVSLQLSTPAAKLIHSDSPLDWEILLGRRERDERGKVVTAPRGFSATREREREREKAYAGSRARLFKRIKFFYALVKMLYGFT